jgi:hypothetical protein
MPDISVLFTGSKLGPNPVQFITTGLEHLNDEKYPVYLPTIMGKIIFVAKSRIFRKVGW